MILNQTLRTDNLDSFKYMRGEPFCGKTEDERIQQVNSSMGLNVNSQCQANNMSPSHGCQSIYPVPTTLHGSVIGLPLYRNLTSLPALGR